MDNCEQQMKSTLQYTDQESHLAHMPAATLRVRARLDSQVLGVHRVPLANTKQTAVSTPARRVATMRCHWKEQQQQVNACVKPGITPTATGAQPALQTPTNPLSGIKLVDNAHNILQEEDFCETIACATQGTLEPMADRALLVQQTLTSQPRAVEPALDVTNLPWRPPRPPRRQPANATLGIPEPTEEHALNVLLDDTKTQSEACLAQIAPLTPPLPALRPVSLRASAIPGQQDPTEDLVSLVLQEHRKV